MKRISSLLLVTLFFCAPIMAQVNTFSQRGKVTQDLQTEGLFIAHPALPLNSKAFIVNTTTGKELEVTIIRHITASTSRIADISPGVGIELELNPNSEVKIYTTTNQNKTGQGGPAQSAPMISQSNLFPPPPRLRYR